MSKNNSKHGVDKNMSKSELQEALSKIAEAMGVIMGADTVVMVKCLDAAPLKHEKLDDDLSDVVTKYCCNVRMLNAEIQDAVGKMNDWLDSALDALSIKYGADAIGEALVDHPSQLADIQMADSAIDRLKLFCELTKDQMSKTSSTCAKQPVCIARALKKTRE